MAILGLGVHAPALLQRPRLELVRGAVRESAQRGGDLVGLLALGRTQGCLCSPVDRLGSSPGSSGQTSEARTSASTGREGSGGTNRVEAIVTGAPGSVVMGHRCIAGGPIG